MYPFDSQSNKIKATYSGTHLYFLAIIPPPEIQARINELKQVFAKDFQSSHALKSPPHITVIPPFKLLDSDLIQVHRFLENNHVFKESAEISLNGFGCFKPRVIFIHPEIPSGFINARCTFFDSFFLAFPKINLDSKPYHPHLTLAFKDLSPAMFNKAWARFSNSEFHATFLADRLYLLRYEASRWEIFKEYPFDIQQSMP